MNLFSWKYFAVLAKYMEERTFQVNWGFDSSFKKYSQQNLTSAYQVAHNYLSKKESVFLANHRGEGIGRKQNMDFRRAVLPVVGSSVLTKTGRWSNKRKISWLPKHNMIISCVQEPMNARNRPKSQSILRRCRQLVVKGSVVRREGVDRPAACAGTGNVLQERAMRGVFGPFFFAENTVRSVPNLDMLRK